MATPPLNVETKFRNVLAYDVGLYSPEVTNILNHFQRGKFEDCLQQLAEATRNEDLADLGFNERTKSNVVLNKIVARRTLWRRLRCFCYMEKIFAEHDLGYDSVEFVSVDELEVACSRNPWILLHSLYDSVKEEVLVPLFRKLVRHLQITEGATKAEQYALLYMLLKRKAQDPYTPGEGVRYEEMKDLLLEADLKPVPRRIDLWDVSCGAAATHALFDESIENVQTYFSESTRDAAARVPTRKLRESERQAFLRLLNHIILWKDPETDVECYRLRPYVDADETLCKLLFP